MMLYVFHVEVGRMMNFDMTVALSSVENLKDTINRLHGIPAKSIVLLVSGGEMLTESTQVSCYSAGTDTNPIYMFLNDTKQPPPVMAQLEPDIDLRDQVDRCLELPAVYETVAIRAKLALQMHELARDEERLCERLVYEQHLQQQGWSAVVANMEDLTEEFRQRFSNFCVAFDIHLEKRNKYLELLRNFADDLTKLARIPILPGLMPLAEADFHGFDELLNTDEIFSRSSAQQESVLMVGAAAEGAAAAPYDSNTKDSDDTATESNNASTDEKSSTSPNKKLKMGNEAIDAGEGAAAAFAETSSSSSTRLHNLNLLQWITSKENHNTLQLMSDECIQGLGTFNDDVYSKLKSEVQNIIKLATQGDVKEIKGLSERLSKLEEFKYKVKRMVQDQKELSTAFQQNQNRAINLRDASILPDLCASHQSQLVVMLQNHQKIRDHRRCIAKAKDELGGNLFTRLERIVLIENAMSQIDSRLLFYRSCLRRAERHINIIEQIHKAPNIYVAAVSEVVRRKIFSREFRRWASTLAGDFDTIHNDEIKRRQLFNATFEGHFLNILFPGMNDMPPAFANENPLIFDTRLPNITKSDIEMLSSQVPDLASLIELPDMGPVINFFVSRSGAHQKERLEELLKQQVAAAIGTGANATVVTSGEKLPQHQRLSELQKEATGGACDESETDTDIEFEKVPPSMQTMATSTSENRSPDTMARSTATELLLMQSAETITDETESSMRAEIDRLRGVLKSMSHLLGDCISLARANLETVRSDAQMHREDLQSELHLLTDKWNVMRMQCEAREEQLQQKSAACDQELQLLRETLQSRDRELEALQQEHALEINHIQMKCLKLETELGVLQDMLQKTQCDKDVAVAKAREELIHEHKTEIESLRCRYKLMTSMERSPSDSSLEKLERPASSEDNNVIELAQHEAMLAQLRADLDAEKQKQINAAIEAERSLWQSKIFPINSESVMANVCLRREMLEEKERQLELMREKDLMLTKENYQLKTRIDALTNEDGNSWLKEKIEYLHRDKCRLEEELTMEKSKRVEMESSFAALRCSTYEHSVLPRSKSSGSSHKYIVLESCGRGDLVFVVWNVRHSQFMIVQDSQSLYFLHGDSLAGLNLRLPTQADGTAPEDVPVPVPYYAIGRVVDKEYCQARKDENRYRVTRGSKFYRIKLSPLQIRQATRRERLDTLPTSIQDSYASSAASPAALSASVLRQSPAPSSTGTTLVGPSTPSTKDSTDSVTTASPTNANAASGIGLGFKERTISITSATEEDDEPLSLISERCRYSSVSEEDEPSAGAAAAVGSLMTNTVLQESVITEQPTASNKLNLDLLLASADLPPAGDASEATKTSPIAIAAVTTAAATTTTTQAVFGTTISAPTIFIASEGADTNSPTIPTSIGTTSEDSDEYRSLEGKDEPDFPISE